MTPGRATAGLALVLLLAGCGGTAAPVVRTAPPAGRDVPAACPQPHNGPSAAIIDWVDFIRLHGRMYSRLRDTGSTVDRSLIGEVRARVLCRLDGVVTDPDYQARDGDASFLTAGTEVRAFGHADPALRLAVHVEHAWRVYEVLDGPGARTGSDLLDLGVGVEGIDLLDGDTATRVLATLDQPDVVRRVVDAVLAAPVLASPPDGLGRPVFLRFRLTDGTSVQRPWDREAVVLAQRLAAPTELELVLGPDQ